MQLAAPFQHTTHSNSTRTTHPGIHTKSALRQVGCFCHYHVNTQHTTTHNNTTTQLNQLNTTHTIMYSYQGLPAPRWMFLLSTHNNST
mmetsp:Transcript_96632/g.141330  ORF Transcript_96632/g.141330 Transcript_96632/m.141330 type:complete len:88 (-) Transcript_96632:1048-1311(-)